MPFLTVSLTVLTCLVLQGGCVGPNVSSRETITSPDLDGVERADEWHYDFPDESWTTVEKRQNQFRVFAELRSEGAEEAPVAARVTEEVVFGEDPEALMTSLLEGMKASLEASDQPFSWEILSERPGEVVVEWSGALEGTALGGQYELRRLQTGHRGLYSLAWSAPKDDVGPADRERWLGVLREASLEPATRRTFVLELEAFEISDPELLEELRDIWNNGEASALPAFEARLEALTAEMRPLSRTVVETRERERFSVVHEPFRYKAEVGFFERRPDGVFARVTPDTITYGHRGVASWERHSGPGVGPGSGGRVRTNVPHEGVLSPRVGTWAQRWSGFIPLDERRMTVRWIPEEDDGPSLRVLSLTIRPADGSDQSSVGASN